MLHYMLTDNCWITKKNPMAVNDVCRWTSKMSHWSVGHNCGGGVMHGFLDNTLCSFLCLVEYFTQMLKPLCFNVFPYIKKNILLFIREHFKTNWIEHLCQKSKQWGKRQNQKPAGMQVKILMCLYCLLFDKLTQQTGLPELYDFFFQQIMCQKSRIMWIAQCCAIFLSENFNVSIY